MVPGCAARRFQRQRANGVSVRRVDEEWALAAPYLALLREHSAQRDHDLREVFNGLRFIVKTGALWRFMPHDLPPWVAAPAPGASGRGAGGLVGGRQEPRGALPR